MKAKGAAPGQYLGYALQPVRLFYHLLKCSPDSFVGLEYADDISIHHEGTALLVEQCKSALKQNPVGDWSIDLWKTLSTWASNSASGILDPENTKFHLYVTPLKNSKLAQLLSDAKSDSEIDKILDGVKRKHSKLSKVPKCEQHLQSFFAADPTIVRAIVRNFVLVNEDHDPLDPIYDHLDSTVNPEILEQACIWGIGHAKQLVDACIRSGEDPLISARTFRVALRAFIAKYDVARVLLSLSDAPSGDVVSEVVSKSPPFIRQLEIVEANAEIKTRAASDFLRASADRTNWADAGIIFEDSALEYDEALKKRYANLKGELGITSADLDDAELGRLLYFRCCRGTAGHIEGKEVPNHFLSGSLNSLADRLEVGWHPDYEEILKKDGKT